MMATMDATDADAGAGQAAANSAAGKVSRVLPQVQIDRSATQIIAAVSSPVLWNDDLNSGPSGRAHITLTDGSLLNLGSNSTLRVLQHDAQAQQTSLDLVIGRMRGQVLKLTRPGAKFEIRTPVGTAGLVGTDFSLLVTDDYVELMVFEGIVRFTIFANGQSITVTAGQKLRIPRNGAAVGPLPASPQEMQTAKDLTDIPEKRSPIGAIFAALGHNPPVTVSVSVGAAVLGISLFLNTQEHPSVSPWRPSGQ
jgi:ferric-dicitrate binding protein FerR (iron transport regulator)